MSMLQYACARCGFQAFVEHAVQATGWQVQTRTRRSLCPACQVDEKAAQPSLTPSAARSDRNRRTGDPSRPPSRPTCDASSDS